MTSADLFWFVVFLATAVASVAVSQRYLQHWFTPLSMYVGMNGLSMAFYHLKLLDMINVSAAVHGLLLGSMLLFGIGVAAALRGRELRDEPPPSDPRDLSRLSYFFYGIALLSTLGWVIQTGLLVLRYGIGGLLGNIWVLQTEFQVQFVGYLNLLGILVLPTYLLKRALGRARPLDLIIVAFSLLGLLLAGIKSYTTYAIISGMVVWSVRRPRDFKLHHAAAGVTVLVLFYVMYNQYVDIFVEKAFSSTETGEKIALLQRPYLYFVGVWPALTQVVRGAIDTGGTPGFVTLYPVWKLLAAVGMAESMDKNFPFVHIGCAPFNVYAFVGGVYWDWGTWGALAGSWLLGFVSTRLYLRVLRLSYWGHTLVYAVICNGVFLSIYSYYYRFNAMVLLLVIYVFGFVVLRGGIFVDHRESRRRGTPRPR